MKIAISGLSGVGSSSTAKLVSQRVNLPMTNFTFRQLAVEKGISFEELQTQAATNPEIDFELDRRLIEFVNSHGDCLAATDIACWLDDAGVYGRLGLDAGATFNLKIWLDAPLNIRAKRMHAREGGTLQQVIDYNHQRDLDNRERYLQLYGIDIFDHDRMDWVIDTSGKNLEEVVQLICDRITKGSQAA